MILHDADSALDFTMFWTGAMFALTPVILGGVVLALWWRGRKRQRQETDPGPRPSHPAGM